MQKFRRKWYQMFLERGHSPEVSGCAARFLAQILLDAYAGKQHEGVGARKTSFWEMQNTEALKMMAIHRRQLAFVRGHIRSQPPAMKDDIQSARRAGIYSGLPSTLERIHLEEARRYAQVARMHRAAIRNLHMQPVLP